MFIYDLIWKEPLRTLYLHGPNIAGYGFWANRLPEDICAELTSVSSAHWTKESALCHQLIEDHFESFHVGVTSLVYFVFLFWLTLSMICHFCFIRPIVNKLT